MNWLSTRQAYRLLNYRGRQLKRVAFAIQHRDTPAGREWAEESLQQFKEALQTGTCPHCGYRANPIIRHLRQCQYAPDVEVLATEYRTNRVGLNELAEKYQLHPRTLKWRLMAGGVTSIEIEERRRQLIEVRRRQLIGGRLSEDERCQCGIRLFKSPYQLPTPLFEWRIHANVRGYCPTCALKLGKITLADLTTFLNHSLH